MADLAPIETDWITDADPAHPGVYKRKYPDGVPYPVLFHKWDGRKWLIGHGSPELADAESGASVHHGLPWRGVVPQVSGCVAVEAPAETVIACSECAFRFADPSCLGSQLTLACGVEKIIWRPRGEVQA